MARTLGALVSLLTDVLATPIAVVARHWERTRSEHKWYFEDYAQSKLFI